MQYKFIAPLLFCLSISPLFAQTNVAVLNAILGDGVPVNASAIVADTINEQFVNSEGYTAIDRAYISSIQEEKNFQLSGDVQEQDIKELGNTFGADYICIAYVGLLGSTYSVSARLIEVETAKVILQESHRLQGEIDVLFTVAEVVGAKMVGSNLDTAVPVTMAVADEAAAEEQTQETQPPAEENPAVPADEEGWDYYADDQQDEPKGVVTDPRIHFIFSWMFAGYSGDDGNDTFSGDDYYSYYEMDQYFLDNGYSSADANHIGLDFHMLFPVWKFIYVGGGLTFTRESLDLEDALGSYTYANFNTLEPYINVGGIIAFFDVFQVYGGLSLGGFLFVLGTSYSGDATDSLWSDAGATAFGISIGFELGVTAWLGVFGLDIRYKWSQSPSLVGDQIFTSDYKDLSGGDTSFGHNGITLGLGFAF